MRVRLRNPDRDVDVAGPRKVRDVLSELGIDQVEQVRPSALKDTNIVLLGLAERGLR